MSTSFSPRAQLITAAFVALTAFATWSITTVFNSEVQVTVKR